MDSFPYMSGVVGGAIIAALDCYWDSLSRMSTWMIGIIVDEMGTWMIGIIIVDEMGGAIVAI